MCMENPKQIISDKVPKYGYKVLVKKFETGLYITPFWEQEVKLGAWIKSGKRKNTYDIHEGRISILENKEDAEALCKLLSGSCFHVDDNCFVIKVLIKQTTEFAYKGEMTFFETKEVEERLRKCTTYVVDQIKVVEE